MVNGGFENDHAHVCTWPGSQQTTPPDVFAIGGLVHVWHSCPVRPPVPGAREGVPGNVPRKLRTCCGAAGSCRVLDLRRAHRGRDIYPPALVSGPNRPALSRPALSKGGSRAPKTPPRAPREPWSQMSQRSTECRRVQARRSRHADLEPGSRFWDWGRGWLARPGTPAPHPAVLTHPPTRHPQS